MVSALNKFEQQLHSNFLSHIQCELSVVLASLSRPSKMASASSYLSLYIMDPPVCTLLPAIQNSGSGCVKMLNAAN